MSMRYYRIARGYTLHIFRNDLRKYFNSLAYFRNDRTKFTLAHCDDVLRQFNKIKIIDVSEYPMSGYITLKRCINRRISREKLSMYIGDSE